jgi:hypothetical protein
MRLAAQKTIRFAGYQEGAGIIMGGLCGCCLVSSGRHPTLCAAIEAHTYTYLAGILRQSHREIDNNPEQGKTKYAANDSRFRHCIYSLPYA